MFKHVIYDGSLHAHLHAPDATKKSGLLPSLFPASLFLAFTTASVAHTAEITLPVTAQPVTDQSATEAVLLPQIVVTANPLGSALFDLVSPVSVLSGKDLSFRQESTLGETLSKLPGVSSTYFGPNASRPVIRGLDGDRVRIMQNGIGLLDVSALSFDHATAIDPLVTDRIEVVRGPAALMYGGAAVGGVVNSLDNRIPQSPIEGMTGVLNPGLAVPPTSAAVPLL